MGKEFQKLFINGHLGIISANNDTYGMMK